MARRDPQVKVGLNAKIESVQFLAIETDGSVDFIEGAPLALNSTTGLAQTAVAGDVVFINFLDSQRSDIEFLQNDPFNTDLPTVSLQSGGLSGIQGQVDVGLLAEAWDGGVLPAIGDFVTITNGLFASAGAAPAAGTDVYGKVYRYNQDRAYFVFDSVPRNIS